MTEAVERTKSDLFLFFSTVLAIAFVMLVMSSATWQLDGRIRRLEQSAALSSPPEDRQGWPKK